MTINTIVKKVFDELMRIVVPVIYLYFWYMIPISLLGSKNVNTDSLIIGALPVIFIGLLSRQTSWSVGGEKGIKGDNIGLKTRATLDRRGSFEFQGIEMNETKVDKVIESVEKNEPLFKT